jgi:hypothetical protein
MTSCNHKRLRLQYAVMLGLALCLSAGCTRQLVATNAAEPTVIAAIPATQTRSAQPTTTTTPAAPTATLPPTPLVTRSPVPTHAPLATPTAIAATWTLSKSVTLIQYDATFQIWTSQCVPDDEGASYQQELLLSVGSMPTPETVARRSYACRGGLGAYGLDYVGESVGGRYVYYTDAAYGEPDGGGPYPWQRSGFRYDVETRSQIDIKLDVAAPNKKLSAYNDKGAFTLFAWESGQIRTMPQVWKGGSLMATAWTTDSMNAAFLESEQFATIPGTRLALTVWDITANRSFTASVPAVTDGSAPLTISWTQPNKIQLSYSNKTTRMIRFTGEQLVLE